uniref:Uncharacterized protein n=1 Tax=Oryza nivara TaxID=4536 RepID=A0A0E0GPX6_ORYNI
MHGTAGYGQDGAQVAWQRPREVPRSSNDPPLVTAAQDGAKVCALALHAMVEVQLQDAMAIGENFGQIDEGVSIYDISRGFSVAIWVHINSLDADKTCCTV